MNETTLLVAVQDRDLLISLLIFLREVAEFDIAGTARDPASLVALMTSTHPDVVLVDEALFDGGVAAIIEPLRCLDPRPRLVVMAAEENHRASASCGRRCDTQICFTGDAARKPETGHRLTPTYAKFGHRRSGKELDQDPARQGLGCLCPALRRVAGLLRQALAVAAGRAGQFQESCQVG